MLYSAHSEGIIDKERFPLAKFSSKRGRLRMFTYEAGIASVQQAIKDVAEGKFVIVIDAASRETKET